MEIARAKCFKKTKNFVTDKTDKTSSRKLADKVAARGCGRVCITRADEAAAWGMEGLRGCPRSGVDGICLWEKLPKNLIALVLWHLTAIFKLFPEPIITKEHGIEWQSQEITFPYISSTTICKNLKLRHNHHRPGSACCPPASVQFGLIHYIWFDSPDRPFEARID